MVFFAFFQTKDGRGKAGSGGHAYFIAGRLLSSVQRHPLAVHLSAVF
jgi:hypothetical protein